MNLIASEPTSPAPVEPLWLELIRTKIETLRFGAIQLTVHDGEVTQIETTEKMRVPKVRD